MIEYSQPNKERAQVYEGRANEVNDAKVPYRTGFWLHQRTRISRLCK
jgi:hypothetical protein